MCGIVAAASQNNVVNILADGLKLKANWFVHPYTIEIHPTFVLANGLKL